MRDQNLVRDRRLHLWLSHHCTCWCPGTKGWSAGTVLLIGYNTIFFCKLSMAFDNFEYAFGDQTILSKMVKISWDHGTKTCSLTGSVTEFIYLPKQRSMLFFCTSNQDLHDVKAFRTLITVVPYLIDNVSARQRKSHRSRKKKFHHKQNHST